MKFLKYLIFIVILLLLPITIFASKSKAKNCETGFRKNSWGVCEEVKAPERGKLNSFKDDFECERGFRKNLKNWSCDEIKLPENGVLTLAGNDWTCIANYKRSLPSDDVKRENNECVKVILPENAKFAVQGSDWYCNFSYERQGDKCVKLEIPNNARWSYDGNDWECNKGFKESEDGKSCTEVKISTNANANYIGGFTCNSGYKKEGDECKKVPDVENGKFYTTGADFYCLNGYQKNESERKCEKIKIPENAHEDNLSLEGWACNSEFLKEGSECKKFTLPEHGFWFNNNWGCEQGYRKNFMAKSCEKISIPDNAHTADTYDGWLCNEGYTKNYKENRCDKVNP